MDALAKVTTEKQTRRVLLYSHDTFGLGHLRRSRAIAGALTLADESMSALIVTGSPVAGRFTFPERVDHIRLPSVTKMTDGSYVSESLGLDIDTTTAIRAGLIKSAVQQYSPNLIIVDKEPSGLRGELLPALRWLKKNSDAEIVLGLRDVLDAPDLLAAEWKRKDASAIIQRFYDEIWVYGLKSIYDPTEGLDLPKDIRQKIHWAGYLRREAWGDADIPDEPYVLITPGGGGDGEAMVDQVLTAYEADPTLRLKARLVYGPFLSGDKRERFEERVEKLCGRVETTGFESKMESLMAHAQGVIAMGGYNTFCEILSFDKPAIIVPRTQPRLEQYIRASRAQELGLVKMVEMQPPGSDPAMMIAAIRDLPQQAAPSARMIDGLLDGLEFLTKRTDEIVQTHPIRTKG